MKITKFVHSCLLVETDKEAILFDPGVFSWNSGLCDVEALPKLDTIVITHEHPDHFHQPFVQALIQKFPEVCFITTPSVLTALQEMGIKNAHCESTPSLQVFSTKPHAHLGPLGPTPENIAVHVDGRLTVGGDRHDLEESKEILALPITAPWGSVEAAAEMVLRLNPKYVIPIHDWHWNDDARQAEYKRSGGIYKEHGITLVEAVDGQVIEL